MTRSRFVLALAAGAAAASLVGCNQAPPATNTARENSTAEAPPSDSVKSAESAAPAAIADGAAIATIDATGAMKTIRAGSNGWTCMPDSPATPGPDPMCLDSNAAKWAAAWIGHKPPPEGVVGVIYMLEGGTDASNTDPYAARPTADNDWIKTGPHVMVVGSREILAGYPAGARPDTSVPYVMWAGTPYAHLMVPLKPAT